MKWRKNKQANKQQQQKPMKPRAGSLKRSTIDKPLVRLMKEKKTHKIRNERERKKVTTNTTEIQQIIREHHERLCQQITQPRRNERIPRNTPSSKTESGRNRKTE